MNMKVFSSYVMLNDGTCIFSAKFLPMPESALITAMISAMQAFIKEVSGNYAKKLSTGGFVFHIDRVGKLVFILATSEDQRPDEEMGQIRTRFLHKYGASIDSFRGVTDEFTGFEKDLKEILDIKTYENRIEPTKQLNSFALLQIPKDLQPASRALIMKKELNAKQMSEELEITPLEARKLLDELHELGYAGRFHDGWDFIYFV